MATSSTMDVVHLDGTTRGNWTKLMFCGRFPVLHCPICHVRLMDFLWTSLWLRGSFVLSANGCNKVFWLSSFNLVFIVVTIVGVRIDFVFKDT